MLDLTRLPTPEAVMETIEDVEKFERTPRKQQFPYTDSYHLISDSASRFGGDIALEFLLQGLVDEPSQSVSFAELSAQITRTANALHGLGIGPEDAVSIVLPILPQTHFATWGAQAAGIANPINPMLDADHLGEIMAAAGARAVICLGPSPHSDIWDKVLIAAKNSGSVKTILCVNIPGLCAERPDSEIPDALEILDFDSCIAQHDASVLDSRRKFSGDQIAAYFHTGGTTGRPKLAQLTHDNMAFLGQLMQVYTAHLERHTVLCGLPLFHIYGCIIQGIAAFSVGYRIVLMTPSGFRSPEAMKNFWHYIERFQVQSFATVPTVLMALSDIPVGDADISCLTTINSGAAPLSHAFELGFEEKFEVEIGNGYGMTETTALISRAPLVQPPGSVGMRIPYSQIRIVHLEENQVSKDCDLGESGVILVQGPQVFKGYKRAVDNANAWIEDDWFNTGDLGYLDAEGYLCLSGRAKDLIIRGGHNIDPETIEEPLNAHPEVAVAIAVGLPDPYTGELPMAYVVTTADSKISEDELLDYCKQEISERAAVPKRIIFVEAMPLTVIGKVFRPLLRQMISEAIISEHLLSESIIATVSSEIEKKRGLVLKIVVDDKGGIETANALLSGYTFTVEVS